MQKLQGLKFQGYKGSWHEIERTNMYNQEIVLLESEQFGNDICGMIAEIDKNGNAKLVVDESWDGFSDYDEYVMERDVWSIISDEITPKNYTKGGN